MFYATPKDLLQAAAAQELYQREWKYHGEQRLWLKARTQQELMQSHPTVQYVYFDVNAWEARLFTNTPATGHISSGFLSGNVRFMSVECFCFLYLLVRVSPLMYCVLFYDVCCQQRRKLQ